MLKYFRRRFFKLITGYTWLRSGSYDYAYKYSYLTSSAYWNVAYPARLLAVRPATHKKASPWGEAPRSGDEGVYKYPLIRPDLTVSPPSPEGEG